MDNYGFTCLCIPGYTGSYCEQLINYCASGPCMNGATCYSSKPSKYKDEFCLIKKHFKLNCFLDSYVCNCAQGYTGTTCQTMIDPCTNSQCAAGSSCQRIPNTIQYVCVCPFNYRGVYCDQLIPACESNPCVNGNCTTLTNGNYFCNCPIGYSGIDCSVVLHACGSLPCLNGATCYDYPGLRYLCCQTQINLCNPSPCQNSGSCQSNSPGTYFCNCLPQYTGTNCEIQLRV